MNNLSGYIPSEEELLRTVIQRLEIGQKVEEVVIRYLRMLVDKQPDPESIYSYFTELVEIDIACNVNGYDRTIDDFKGSNQARLIGSIIMFITTQLNFLFGEANIRRMRRDAFGPNGGVQVDCWVSGAAGLYIDAGSMKFQTSTEDFALWLIIRAAKIIILDGAASQPEQTKK